MPARKPRTSRPPSLIFVPADVPFQVGNVHIGNISSDRLTLSVTPGLKGFLLFCKSPTIDSSGYFLIQNFTSDKSLTIPFVEKDCGHLTIQFDGYGKETRAGVGLTNIDQKVSTHIPIIVPPTGGTFRFAVAPGEYRAQIGIPGSGIFVPRTVNCTRGASTTLHYGSKISARIHVRGWTKKILNLWFHLFDDKDNYLFQFPREKGHLKLTQAGQTLFDGPGISSRFFKIGRDWGRPARRKSVQFEYTASSPLFGPILLAGTVPSDPNQFPIALLPLAYASPRVEIRFSDCTPEAAKRVADAMETGLDWLFKNYAGPVHRRTGDRFLVRSNTPVGIGVAGGANINVSVYSGYILDPRINYMRVLFHELGHSYQACPPHHQAKGMDKPTGESIASLVGDYCVRAVFGESTFRETTSHWSGKFFNAMTDKPAKTDEEMPDDEIVEEENEEDAATVSTRVGIADKYDFIYHYIHLRFGQKVNRDFFRIMYASEGNCEQILLSADFLQTEAERSAALYSFLAGENLAWLYKWAGFDVDSSKITRAMPFFKQNNAIPPP